jgi:hypothetical protein
MLSEEARSAIDAGGMSARFTSSNIPYYLHSSMHVPISYVPRYLPDESI